MDAGAFKQSVLDHLLYTCAQDPRDASGADLYRAFAHTVRDRLVHRWLATQRTYRRARRQARLLPLVRVPDRAQPRAVPAEPRALRDRGERWPRSAASTSDAILDQEGDPGLGNGGLGRLAACFMDSLATLALPAVGYGIRYDFGIFEQRIEDGRQVELHDNWLQSGNPWELPRLEDAQMVRLGGRTETRHDPDGRLRVDWIPARTILGVPYDSFIVGHKTDTVNTLRLWAARATQDFNLQLLQRGRLPPRGRGEDRLREHLEGPLPERPHRGGQGAAPQAAVLLRRLLGRRHRAPLQAAPPHLPAVPQARGHPAERHPPVDRDRRADAHLRRRGGRSTGTRPGPSPRRTFGYTNHTLLPEALERWPVPLFERLLPRHLQIIFEINQRFLRRVQTRWPGDAGRIARACRSIEESSPPSRCAWRTWRRSARTA